MKTVAIINIAVLLFAASTIAAPVPGTFTVWQDVVSTVIETKTVYVDPAPPQTNLALAPTSTAPALIVAPTTTSTTTTTTTTPPPVIIVPATTTTPAPAATTTAPAPVAKVDTGSSGGGEFSGEATYYTPGLGSCGYDNTEAEKVVALSLPLMANGANPNANPKCGKTLTVHRGGKSVSVKVVDSCYACAQNDVDLSPAAYNELGAVAEGRFDITWSWD